MALSYEYQAGRAVRAWDKRADGSMMFWDRENPNSTQQIEYDAAGKILPGHNWQPMKDAFPEPGVTPVPTAAPASSPALSQTPSPQPASGSVGQLTLSLDGKTYTFDLRMA